MFSGFKALIQLCWVMGFCLEPPLVLSRGEQSSAGWLRGYGPSCLSPLIHWVTKIPLQHLWSSSLLLIYLFMKEMLCEPVPCWPQLSPVVFGSISGAPAVFPAHWQPWSAVPVLHSPSQGHSRAGAQLLLTRTRAELLCAGRGSPSSFPLMTSSQVTGSEAEGHLGTGQSSPSACSRVS